MNPIEVDYLVIGGGIAGLTLSRFLEADRVVCLEPKPCSFKVGEAISPDHFDDPRLLPIAASARSLPSYSEKVGSIFVFDDSAAVYPTSTHGAQVALHVRRDELEALMIREWRPPLRAERAIDVDLDRKLVRTDHNVYRVCRQILDCSGPAMFMARSLGAARKLWDVYCSWFYLDVQRIDDRAFERWLETRDMPLRAYDAKAGSELHPAELGTWSPSRYTYVRNVADGAWLWQIPLYRRREISFGMTSVHGKVTLDHLREAVEAHLAPMFDARPKPLDGSSPHHKTHVRNHYAMRTDAAATLDYIIVGDAYYFGDPIYATGTTTASSDALEVAEVLNRTGWTEEACAAYNARKQELVDRSIAAHYFSPHNQAADLDRDAAAVDGARCLRIHTFNYASVIAQTKVGFAHNRERGGSAFESPYRSQPRELLAEVTRRLGLDAARRLGAWTLRLASGHAEGAVELGWTHPDKPTLTILLRRDGGGDDHYRRYGPMTLAYMNVFDRHYPLDHEVEALFDAIGNALSTWPRWQDGPRHM